MLLLLCLLALFLLLITSALLSASETAFFSLSSMKVKSFGQASDPKKQLIASLLAHPGDLLVTIMILNVISNILIQNVFSSLFKEDLSWWVHVGVPLALVLIFGEALPKSIAFAYNTQVALWAAPPMRCIQKILLPLRSSLTYITNFVSRVLFCFLHKEEEISIEELRHALHMSHKSGVLNSDEAELMRGYLRLQEATVKELMRPREEVLYFDIEDNISELMHLLVDQECSRIPVCTNSLDNVLGIMTSKLFFMHKAKLQDTKSLKELVQKPFFVPESMPAEALLKAMYTRNESLAIVVDEYSSVSGLITLEDLVETVVGEIVDRRDEKSRYTRSGENVVIASGKLELAEFANIFDIPLKSQNHMVTLGGWLTEMLGDIPKSGTKYTTKDFLFHILSADATRIKRVYISKRGKPK